MGDSNPHFNFSPHLGDTLTCSPVCAGGATRTHIIPLPTQPKTPATDGRTRLERVEWHTGGLSATDAHHLCFVPLLYHNLGDLSRGFFYDFSYRFATFLFRLPCGIVKGFSVGCPSHSQSVQWLAHRSCSTIVRSKSRLRFCFHN